MIYTCPKCGKKMDLSTEVLINSEYKVICPQCLCQLQIVGDYAYIPHDSLDLDTAVEPSHTITCPRCGHETSSGPHFCPNCGTSFDGSPSPSTTAVDIAPEEVDVLPPPLPDADPLFHDALQFLSNCSSITPMMLRDHYGISEERAANLLRQLEEAGAVGPYNNGGPRQILIPHRGIYQLPRQTMAQGPQQRRGSSRHGGMGCFTWFLLLILIMFLIRSCGG